MNKFGIIKEKLYPGTDSFLNAFAGVHRGTDPKSWKIFSFRNIEVIETKDDSKLLKGKGDESQTQKCTPERLLLAGTKRKS